MTLKTLRKQFGAYCTKHIGKYVGNIIHLSKGDFEELEKRCLGYGQPKRTDGVNGDVIMYHANMVVIDGDNRAWKELVKVF